MTRVRGSEQRTTRQTVISDEEFEEACYRAEGISDEFMRLRARALLCVLRLTGKRRGEIANLKVGSFKVEKRMLNITFTLEKKRKKSTLQSQATKSISLKDPLTQPIIMYLEYLSTRDPKPAWFLPRVKNVYGLNTIIPDAHIGGRQVFNIVRSTSEAIWPHLFRETVASDIIKQDQTIIAAFRVMERLDLQDYETGFHYLRRFAKDIIEREQRKT